MNKSTRKELEIFKSLDVNEKKVHLHILCGEVINIMKNILENQNIISEKLKLYKLIMVNFEETNQEPFTTVDLFNILNEMQDHYNNSKALKEVDELLDGEENLEIVNELLKKLLDDKEDGRNN